ncbi:histidinol phosphatase [Mucilaginibacter hurinus]|uniref:protein-tyrosine-phosphatase n=1 Tax=Mucilaginibacter hurinus TaxID=2201324 RepID=A0A367GVG8_9SPHI|nr:CpsB/CapC family capsule biosynthesis tyrosine phosphatase [Mucilaginibacter hurinus]RCH56663.1 histidinol phosphatase [Mucilaginibacter hurinus]
MFSFFKKPLPEVRFDWLGTDMHSHLLPGIDDGSPDVESSIRYISALNDLGFNRFFCTPHIFMELYPNNRETITAALNQVKQSDELKGRNIRIDAAAEYMVNQDFGPLVKETNLLTLPGNYVLIEMSYLAESPDIEAYVFDLSIKGYKPILAHPERYNFYHGMPQKIERFKDMGCLLQLNLLSVTGYYGKEVKETSLKLLKNKWYDLAGTDFHHDKHLRGMREPRAWKDGFDKVKAYGFKNTELFG